MFFIIAAADILLQESKDTIKRLGMRPRFSWLAQSPRWTVCLCLKHWVWAPVPWMVGMWVPLLSCSAQDANSSGTIFCCWCQNTHSGCWRRCAALSNNMFILLFILLFILIRTSIETQIPDYVSYAHPVTVARPFVGNGLHLTRLGNRSGPLWPLNVSLITDLLRHRVPSWRDCPSAQTSITYYRCWPVSRIMRRIIVSAQYFDQETVSFIELGAVPLSS